MAYLLLFFSLCVGYYLFQWIQNYNIARKIGFPIYLTPLSPQNIAWLFIGASYQPQLEKYLPKWAYDRIIPSVQGWEHNQKWNVNARLGPVYTLVAPTLNEVWIADPAMAKEVLTRRKDFIQLPMSQLILNRFGPSLPGSNGEVWQHQRRIIAPILNERIMESVWNDGRRLAVKEVGKLEHLVEAMRSVTINILGSTVYGSRVSYQGAEKPPKGYSQTFMTSVINLVSNLILCGVAPVWALKLPIWPKWVKEIGVAAEEFPRHAMTMVEDVRSETERPNSLVGALVKAADADKQNFKEEDIMGNMFTFTLAGYDTTASAFTYAFLILALEPKWQDWIIEEIDHVRAETEGDYASTYPQLQRCLALMLEILRLYTPFARMARWTETEQQLAGHTIPAGTELLLAPALVHVSPEVYGDNRLDFLPTRWQKDGSTIEPGPDGTHFPWSLGPRVCPGKKFSQVEFVSVIYEVFSQFKVEIAQVEGESVDQARAKVQDAVRNGVPNSALTPRNPDQVKLRLVPRKL